MRKFCRLWWWKWGGRKILSTSNYYWNHFLPFVFDIYITTLNFFLWKIRVGKSLNLKSNTVDGIESDNCELDNILIISIYDFKMYWLRIIKVTGIKLQELHFCVVLGNLGNWINGHFIFTWNFQFRNSVDSQIKIIRIRKY